MGRLIHFDVHTADPDAAMRFYEAVLGWSFQPWDGPFDYWLIQTGPDAAPGINGGLTLRRGDGPLEGQAVNSFVCTAEVDDLDATLALVSAAGGRESVPRMAVPGVGWLAYVKDPDGNLVGLMENDPDAA